jgi:hypothetical protein
MAIAMEVEGCGWKADASGERARVERLAFRSARAQPGSGESREIDRSEGATRLEDGEMRAAEMAGAEMWWMRAWWQQG